MRLFYLALSFYTRLPLPYLKTDANELARCLVFLPVVGYVLGALLFAFAGLLHGKVPYHVLVALVVALSVFLTGALHEDGLADFFDGFWGGYTKEKTLSIMKDSRVGVFGLLAVLAVVALRYQFLVALSFEVMVKTVFVAQVFSRGMILPYVTLLPYARQNEGSVASGGLSGVGCFFAILVAFSPFFLFSLKSSFFLLGVLCGSLLFLALFFWWRHRISGYTGDCLGAAQQMQLLLVDFLAVLMLR